MARLLILDTALSRCAVGVMAGGRLAAGLSEQMQRGHAERLFPMIAAALEETGITYGSLDRIAVAAGPGSFTGIRIGISAARGMAVALGIPSVGVGVLEALAEEAGRVHAGDIIAANLGPRETVYWQRFRTAGEAGAQPLTEPVWTAADEASLSGMPGVSLCVGSAATLLADQLGARALMREYPALSAFGSLASRREAGPRSRPAPVYVRPPDARPRS